MPPYDDIDWLLISNNDLKGTRTTIECQLFWMNEMRPGLNQKSEWTAAEQKKLRNLVKNYESRNAKVVMTH